MSRETMPIATNRRAADRADSPGYGRRQDQLSRALPGLLRSPNVLERLATPALTPRGFLVRLDPHLR